MEKRILLYVLLICLVIMGASCPQTNDHLLSVIFDPPPPSYILSGQNTFKVNYRVENEIQDIWICYIKDGTNDFLYYYFNVPEGQLEGSAYFYPVFPVEGGSYKLWAAIGTYSGSNNNRPYGLENSGEPYSVTVERPNEFNIHQLHLTGETLLPTISDPNYNGRQKLNEAFAPTKTRVITIRTTNNLSPRDPQIATHQHAIEWLMNAVGYNNFDRNVTVIAAYDETAPGYIDESITGLMFNRTAELPSMGFVFNTKIRNRYSNTFDQTRVIVGTAIHELGHARGITGDDTDNNISPPHSGNNSASCIMRTPGEVAWYTNPVFCDGHRDFIQSVNWESFLEISINKK